MPIQGPDGVRGALAVADRRPETICADTIACLEMAAMMSGLAISSELATSQLQTAQEENALLRRFMPICAHCKKIRDDEGYWNDFEVYMSQHFDASFSHGICPECLAKHYPQLRMRETE